MNRTAHTQRRLHGFTLIELLVVIAIIAILAAILFPVFAQAKVAAQKSVSISNQKQLGLAVQMYVGEADDLFPQSEYGSFEKHVTWATVIYPYVKNGDKKRSTQGVDQNFASQGIFSSPGNPRPPKPGIASGGQFTYGVHHSIFVNNYENFGGVANPGVAESAIDAPADKIAIMEKGANFSNWNYPWFHDWQQMWVGKIATTPGDPTTVIRDGVDVYTPGSPVYSPAFDSDCVAVTDGKWECAAHARYRFGKQTTVTFVDGHTKSMGRGQIQWFKNIWVDRRNLNPYRWYPYLNGSGWGFPGIH